MNLRISTAWIAVVALALVGCGGGSVGQVEIVVTELPAPGIEPRTHPFAVWTGDQMIVFGGWTRIGDERWWNDGAVYQPEPDHSGSWRTIAPFPYPDAAPNAVAWSGDEMIVVAVEGEYPAETTTVAAAYHPAADTWRSIPAPDGLDPPPTDTPSETRLGIYTAAGPSINSIDGGIAFMVARGRLLGWHSSSDSWVAPHDSDERFDSYLAASTPVQSGALIYQGLANRDTARHGLATIDPATAEVLAVEKLDLPSDLASNIVGPLHPIFDGDELLLLGIESIESEPRKATVLAWGDDDWEIVAQTDDENYAGVGPSGYKTLIHGENALFSLHFNREAGVFIPSDRSFALLDLDELRRCALDSGTVWTGEALLGWNGGHCRDEPIDDSSSAANITVLATPRQ